MTYAAGGNEWTDEMDRRWRADCMTRLLDGVAVPERMVVTYAEALPLGNTSGRVSLCATHDTDEQRTQLKRRYPNVHRGAHHGECALCRAEAAAPLRRELSALLDRASSSAEVDAWLDAHDAR